MGKTVYQILLELYERNELKPLVLNGFCSSSTLRDMEIFVFVTGLTKTGYPKEMAYFDASVQFRVSDRTVKRAVKKLQ
jgi:hypothetical protein